MEKGILNPKVDLYLREGCGRCSNYQTPQCKVNFYPEPLQYLRQILLESGLKEAYKWNQPCYTLKGKNVIMLTAFKDYVCLAFFKGSLMKDSEGVLITPGKHSQAARQLRYTTVHEVKAQEEIIRSYIQEAINLEASGAKVEFKEKTHLEFPEELISKMDSDPVFKQAFKALTPGRQRGYHLYFTAPKQSKTRISRIEKSISRIMQGKGWNER